MGREPVSVPICSRPCSFCSRFPAPAAASLAGRVCVNHDGFVNSPAFFFVFFPLAPRAGVFQRLARTWTHALGGRGDEVGGREVYSAWPVDVAAVPACLVCAGQ